MTSAVVTGCAGFIGSHLSERLLADGWRVHGIDLVTDSYAPRIKWSNLAALENHPGFSFARADVGETDLSTMLASADVVFHLAALPGVRSSWGKGFADYTRANLDATQHVLEALRSHPEVRLVYASSSSVYGNAPDEQATESGTATAPHSPYGVTKRSCELLVDAYRQNHGIRATGLRYFTVYGPRQRPDMLFHRLVESSLGAPQVTIYGTGEQVRDFTFVDDAVAGTILAATAPSVMPPLLNIAGGTRASVRDVIQLVGQLTGSRLTPLSGESAAGDVRSTGGSTELALEHLGWRPAIGLEEGLEEQIDWHRRNRGLLGEGHDTP